jgi:L-threonylcarbamoyladenylate synthase
MVARIDDPETGAALRRVLAGGGVAIMPCDTIYGIVGLAPATEARIARIKGRAQGKPLLRLIGGESWLARYSDAAMPGRLKPFWPGPLTLVFPARGGGTVALRVPADEALRDLLATLDHALASTSVNVEGDPPLGAIAQILEQFESKVDLVVDGGDRNDTAPSTLLDVTATPYRVLRQGAVQIPPDLTRAI